MNGIQQKLLTYRALRLLYLFSLPLKHMPLKYKRQENLRNKGIMSVTKYV